MRRTRAGALTQAMPGDQCDQAADMEILRRAATEDDEQAWEALVARHRPMLLAETRRRELSRLVPEESGEFYVELAFERLWMAIKSPRPPSFDQLRCLRAYLRMCLATAMLDAARARRRTRFVSIDDVQVTSPADPSVAVADRWAVRALWRAIEEELTDESERRLAYLSLVSWLTPRQICARYPDRFPDAPTVYRLKRNMLYRLKHSPKIRALVDASC